METPIVNNNDPVRAAILSILRERADIALPELIAALREYSEADIKRAVWPLVSDQAIELTPQRNLRAKAAGR